MMPRRALLRHQHRALQPQRAHRLLARLHVPGRHLALQHHREGRLAALGQQVHLLRVLAHRLEQRPQLPGQPRQHRHQRGALAHRHPVMAPPPEVGQLVLEEVQHRPPPVAEVRGRHQQRPHREGVPLQPAQVLQGGQDDLLLRGALGRLGQLQPVTPAAPGAQATRRAPPLRARGQHVAEQVPAHHLALLLQAHAHPLAGEGTGHEDGAALVGAHALSELPEALDRQFNGGIRQHGETGMRRPASGAILIRPPRRRGYSAAAPGCRTAAGTARGPEASDLHLTHVRGDLELGLGESPGPAPPSRRGPARAAPGPRASRR